MNKSAILAACVASILAAACYTPAERDARQAKNKARNEAIMQRAEDKIRDCTFRVLLKSHDPEEDAATMAGAAEAECSLEYNNYAHDIRRYKKITKTMYRSMMHSPHTRTKTFTRFVGEYRAIEKDPAAFEAMKQRLSAPQVPTTVAPAPNIDDDAPDDYTK